MSVIDVAVKIPRHGNWKTQRKGLLTEVANRIYKKELRVIVGDVLDGPEIIAVHPSVPKLGEKYVLGNDYDLLATCVDVTIEPSETPFVFWVTATYDTSRLIDLTFDNPLNAPPEIAWSFATYSRPLVRDIRGVPCINSSKEYFDPPLLC